MESEVTSRRSVSVSTTQSVWISFRVKCLQAGKSVDAVMTELVEAYVKESVNVGSSGSGRAAVRGRPGVARGGGVSTRHKPSDNLRPVEGQRELLGADEDSEHQ